MRKFKLLTILGTRPEIIRLSEVIKACERYFDHKLCHTGQNWDYTLNEIFFKELGLRAPDFYLDCAGADLGETMGNVLARSYAILAKEKPDAVLILGDTNSALSSISAKRLKIPIFHMEAGNRCFDQNVPEEINRKIVDHTADVNICYTEHGRRNLIHEGLSAQYTFVTGSPMLEVLAKNRVGIESSDVLAKLGLETRQYIVLSAHREENVDHEGHFTSLMNAVNAVAEEFKLPVVYSTHPRSRKRIEEWGFQFCALVRILPPFGFYDYVNLQKNAFCVLSDSGTLAEESAMLNFPGVLVRTSTERPEAVDAGTVVVGGVGAETILPAIHIARAYCGQAHADAGMHTRGPYDYQETNVGEKVARIILGYTGMVNDSVWRKDCK